MLSITFYPNNFDPEYGRRRFLRNVVIHRLDYIYIIKIQQTTIVKLCWVSVSRLARRASMCTPLKNVAYNRQEEHVKKTYVLEKFDRFLACVTKLFWLRTMYGFSCQEHFVTDKCERIYQATVISDFTKKFGRNPQRYDWAYYVWCPRHQIPPSRMHRAAEIIKHMNKTSCYISTPKWTMLLKLMSVTALLVKFYQKIKLLLMWFQRHPTKAPWNTRCYIVKRFWFWLKYEIGFFFSNMSTSYAVLQLFVQSFGLLNQIFPSSSILDKSLQV
jgi:hypothetical protein